MPETEVLEDYTTPLHSWPGGEPAGHRSSVQISVRDNRSEMGVPGLEGAPRNEATWPIKSKIIELKKLVSYGGSRGAEPIYLQVE
ncbi:hypothetical protein SKAU_G00253780 [Synaphobranchus kaupii]|uniref:Uncharacterized protein n=1 Tax=Synaphobranchus kaupii TaxID=118154 RepID=A0A9Q1F3C5_SYNKA|nr:hypothetical protein SKAU_G00253780 [Synaphobranchus kaupii]